MRLSGGFQRFVVSDRAFRMARPSNSIRTPATDDIRPWVFDCAADGPDDRVDSLPTRSITAIPGHRGPSRRVGEPPELLSPPGVQDGGPRRLASFGAAARGGRLVPL